MGYSIFRRAQLILLVCPVLSIFAQEKISVQAVRLEDPVVVDGDLSEAVWRTAPVIGGFRQLQPVEGAQASQETSVRVAYDDNALYIGADMRDSSPDSIVTRLGRRDADMNTDLFGVFIDAYHDRRSGYYFGLSAGGTLYDGTLTNDDWNDESWDGVWDGGVRKTDRGWTLELRIPFSQLRFQKKDEYVWGINFRRDISRRNEQDYLAYTPKNSSGFVSRFPELTGIRNIRPSRHVEVLPYVRTKAAFTHPGAGDPFNDGSEVLPGAGADVKVGLGNNLTLDVTANPDFGQVEVDPAVVNLSDVETYFNEKRPFFMEGASTFRFGQGGASNYWGFNWWGPTFFYSRRIGRAPQGAMPENDFSDSPEGVHILGAAKVSGKLPGNWNVGTLHAVTRRETAGISLNGNRSRAEIEPAAYYGIFRAQKEINESRQGIGVIATLTERRFDDSRLRSDVNSNALTFGLDGWTFLDTSKTWVLAGWTGGSRVAGTPERMVSLQTSSRHYFQRPDARCVKVDSGATSLSGFAGRFTLNKQKGNVMLNSAVGFLSPGFDVNDAGFMNRTDLINGHFILGYKWTKPGKIFRQADMVGAAFQSYDFDGNSIWRGLFWAGEGQLLNYMRMNLVFACNPATVSKFRTRGGPLTLNHPGTEYDFEFSTDDRKNWVLELEGNRYFTTPEDWWQGLSASLEWKPRDNVSVSAGPGVMWNREFTQWVGEFDDPTAVRTYGKRYVFGEMKQTEISANVRLNWTFTPKLSFQAYIQPLISYGLFSNFKELHRPKSYAFDVYDGDRIIHANGSYEIDPDGAGPARSLTFDNPEFDYKSLRGNAVLRWEYRPGSTLYLVWTQSRWDDSYEEPFSFGRSTERLWNARADNIFMLKATYWWSL
jgi:hypothetical protein